MRNVDYLNIYARYKGITEPIEIYPAFATYRILAGGRENPIVLDQQTGLITALKPGEALIETSYAGWHNWTCVDVEEKPVPGNSYYDKNCAGLLPVGEKLGSTR